MHNTSMESHALGTLLAWCQEEHQRVTISLDRETLFGLASTLQLVLRHPELPPHVRSQVTTLKLALQSLMPEEIQAISRLGDGTGEES